MKSKKMLPLLAATALASGMLTTAAVAIPSVVTASETMADQYQPYYDDALITGSSWGESYLESDDPLPAGTQFMLTDFPDYGVDQNIYFDLSGDRLEFSNWGVDPSGATATARVTVLYPDGTADFISANLTIIPFQNLAYAFSYEGGGMMPGTTNIFPPPRSDLPAGTSVTLIETPTLRELHALEWEIDVVDETSLEITAAMAFYGPRELNLIVNYPDGTVGSANLTLYMLAPPIVNTYEFAYEAITLHAGESRTVSPLNPYFPQDALISVSPSSEVDAIRNQGGVVEVLADGSVEIVIPFRATAGFSLSVEAWYSDGSADVAELQVSIIPADQNVAFDVHFQEPTTTAGTIGIIHSTNGSDLPAGTSLELINDDSLAYLRADGWDFQIVDGLNLAVSIPTHANLSPSVNALVVYPDGTTEVVSIPVWIYALEYLGHDVAYPPLVLIAGKTTTITPITTALPPGTTFTLIEDANMLALYAAGWAFSVATDGKVTVAAPETTAGDAMVQVLVGYPDGSSETTLVDITAITTPGTDDPPPVGGSGGSSFGSS